jgi:hypothetical protein
MQASAINMGASAGCNYEKVPDDIAIAGFQVAAVCWTSEVACVLTHPTDRRQACPRIWPNTMSQ